MLNEGPQPPKPKEFAESVAQSDGYELAAAQTALAQSRHPRVRAFAEQMIADHASMARSLRDAAKASGIEPPTSQVGADQARFLASLQSLRGEEFDREYGRQQVLAHTAALSVLRSYATKGSDSNLRGVASSFAAMVDGHLRTARQMLESGG